MDIWPPKLAFRMLPVIFVCKMSRIRHPPPEPATLLIPHQFTNRFIKILLESAFIYLPHGLVNSIAVRELYIGYSDHKAQATTLLHSFSGESKFTEKKILYIQLGINISQSYGRRPMHNFRCSTIFGVFVTVQVQSQESQYYSPIIKAMLLAQDEFPAHYYAVSQYTSSG